MADLATSAPGARCAAAGAADVDVSLLVLGGVITMWPGGRVARTGRRVEQGYQAQLPAEDEPATAAEVSA